MGEGEEGSRGVAGSTLVVEGSTPEVAGLRGTASREAAASRKTGTVSRKGEAVSRVMGMGNRLQGRGRLGRGRQHRRQRGARSVQHAQLVPVMPRAQGGMLRLGCFAGGGHASTPGAGRLTAARSGSRTKLAAGGTEMGAGAP